MLSKFLSIVYHLLLFAMNEEYDPAAPSMEDNLRLIANDEYDSKQPELSSEHRWLADNPHVISQDSRLQQLFRDSEWTEDDMAYASHIQGQFAIHDMPSFFRVQAHQWILYNMEALRQNDFLARMFEKMRQGQGFSTRDADTLNRTIWSLMNDDDRHAASRARREAERQYGRMERPQRRQSRRPTVAGYPFEIAEAYLNYHRADANQFALSQFEQGRSQRSHQPQYNAVPPPY